MYSRIQEYIKVWERRCYSDGLPDEVPREISDLAPSYKRIAICILRNDFPLKTLGFTPQTSEYYNILKRIELNLPFKRKRMTNQELKEQVYELARAITSKKYYIKGYGLKFRIMDADHNPVKNIDKQTMKCLEINRVVEREGLIFVSDPHFRMWKNLIDVKLPVKEIV